jgi:DNA integrity scanning protein DisA with diadenylate cyclase activity
MFAAIFVRVTAKLLLESTIGNNALLDGVVVVDNSEIFLVAIYCIVQVVEESVVS